MSGFANRLPPGLQRPQRILFLVPMVLVAAGIFTALFFALLHLSEEPGPTARIGVTAAANPTPSHV